MSDDRILRLRDLIRDVPDFPKPGIVFKDITPLLADPTGFATAIDLLAESTRALGADLIAGPEARGFIFGTPLARSLDLGFAPIRKRGKLPWKTIEESYALEYGEDQVQMHEDAVRPGQKVLLVDDLLATGGTMAACRRLVEKAGGEVVGMAFVIELGFLAGRGKLGATSPVVSLIEY
ncbi:MAG: adenine phosphoribosyltransferase [Planctomycetes bacterium]|nr:adenine phosphoribosyltransferase [Planctomycetota bacterium]